MTIFERRSVSADGITLYYISPYQESHHLRTKHTFIYATRREKERRRKRKREENTERDMDNRKESYEKEQIHLIRHSACSTKHRKKESNTRHRFL